MAAADAKIPLTDYAALAGAVRDRQEREGFELGQIAAQSGVREPSLTKLVELRGGLSTGDLLLVCAWLGQSPRDYLLTEVPEWVLERITEANDLAPVEAERLADERSRTAQRQAAAAHELSQLDFGAVLAAAQQHGPASGE